MSAACRDVEIVHHNVAQVPLANNANAFWSVNRDGTAAMLAAAKAARVRKVIYTSSSAVFGVPRELPVTRVTDAQPGEEYGRAKLAGEELCRAANQTGLDVSIIRPRTILGHGRLGIFHILFDWVSKGHPVPVFDDGSNIYQFVHAEDLAAACVAASQRQGFGIYHIGSEHYGSMRGLLTALITHAETRSAIKPLPMRPLQAAMRVMHRLGLSPLGPYHAMMYGQHMYFDISDAKRELGYAPWYSDVEAICESYDWFLANRSTLAHGQRSHHKSAVKKGVVALAPFFLSLMPGRVGLRAGSYLQHADGAAIDRRAA
jgi:nucleoside-diphosphate-sugar epimerase